MPIEIIKQQIFDHLNLKDRFTWPSKIGVELNLRDDLGADSLDLLELVMALEEIFGIAISDDLLEDVKTVGDLVVLVDHKLSGR